MAFDVNSFINRFGLTPDKLMFWKKPARLEGEEGGEVSTDVKTSMASVIIDTSSSIARAVGGPITVIDEMHFPPELIGGTCPHAPGTEEQTVWNAAAETCDTERVHTVWQSYNQSVWYLAVRSSDLASNANSWCPFAALLPGMKGAPQPPICYTYYGEDIASMMTITADTLHIYRGTNPIVRAKAERTARELGESAIINLTSERLAALDPVPWYSVSLFENRARRILAACSIAVSLALTILAFVVWLLASLSLITARHSLDDAKSRTADKTSELMKQAEQLRAAPVRDALTKFSDLNEGLLDLNGYLEVYATWNGKIRWRATVPSNITADRINALGGKTIDSKGPNGTIIGNGTEIEYEAATEKKK